jgi:hypothetical protein
MLGRVVFNPILKGDRVRNARMSKRVNSTGRRKSVKAPSSERLVRHCPHLVFIDPVRYDWVIALLKKRSAKHARTNGGKPDTRANVPRKRTCWPGQHATCGVCGRLIYWGAYGQREHMTCSGARDYKCWSAVSFDGRVAADRIGRAVLAAAEALPGFDANFFGRVQAQAAAAASGRQAAEGRLAREAAEVQQAIGRVVDALEKAGHSDALADRLRELEGRGRDLQSEKALLRGRKDEVPSLPSVDELKDMARAAVGRLAACDPEYGRAMRRIVPSIVIYPFRAIDKSRVVARALVTIELAGLLRPVTAEAAEGLLRQTVWVDLYDPPERVEHLKEVVALRAAGQTQRQVAAALGTDQPTVQRAIALHRMMTDGGLSDPYELITAPLADDRKIRRHLHPRYRYEPLPGFPAWPAHGND